MNIEKVTNCLSTNYGVKQLSKLIACHVDGDGCEETKSLTDEVKVKCDIIDADLDNGDLWKFQDALREAWDVKVEDELENAREEFTTMFKKLLPDSWYYNEMGKFENVFNLKDPYYPYDQWGAKGWKDCEGDSHYGEEMSWYPVRDDLEEDIKEQLEKCKEDLEESVL